LTKQPVFIYTNACVQAEEKRARAWTVTAQTLSYCNINSNFGYQPSHFKTWNIILKIHSIFLEYEFKMRKRREAGKDKWQRLTSCPCFVMPVGVKLIRSQSNSTNHCGFSVVGNLSETCRGMMQGLRFLLIAVKPGKKNVLNQECINSPRN